MNTTTRAATPEQKLAQLCDADHRRVDPAVKALATAITAGAPMPDPYGHRDNFRAVLDAARTYLRDQPSGSSIKSASQRLNAAIAALATDMGKELD